MTAKIFALDLGNKQVKLKSSKDRVRFPSRLLNKHLANSGKFNDFGKLLTQQKELDIHEYQLLNDSETFLLGNDIDQLGKDDLVTDTIQFGVQRYSDPLFLKLCSYSIGLLANSFKAAGSEMIEAEIVIGVPTEDRTKSVMMSLMKALHKQHSLSVDGKQVNVKVTNVIVVPQPVGTLYAKLLNEKLNLTDNQLLEQTIGLVDIGGGTILMDSIKKNFDFEEIDREQQETGIYTLYNRIINNYSGKYDPPNQYEVEHILRAGIESGENKFYYSPTAKISEDITELVQRERQIYTELIIQTVKSTFKNLGKFDLIIFTGGGSNILIKELVEKAIPNCEFAKDSEFSNVEGFYKLGRLQQKQREQGDSNGEV